MIELIMLCQQGKPVGFDCTGHAEFDDPGRDIVCSAVSAITQTTVLGIVEAAKVQAGVSIDEEDGIHCIIDADTDDVQAEKVVLLLETMELGLRSIQQAYPKYLKIMSREV